MRKSNDQFDDQGRLINGFDYERQAWVLGGKYVRCGHSDRASRLMNCQCYGRLHEGEETEAVDRIKIFPVR